MIGYPPLALWLGLDARDTGIFLGGSIHDVAQVVGAGLAVSTGVAGLATIVKIYRVFLLLPVVLLIGVYLRGQSEGETAQAKVPVPYFAFAFLALAALNSADNRLERPAGGASPAAGKDYWGRLTTL